MTKPKPITGVCAIITNPEGEVVTSYADFDGSVAGLKRDDSQTYRARNIIKRRFAREHLNEWLAAKADEYFCEQFWRVAERAGYKLTTCPVDTSAGETP
jgi:hypothetical protein